MAKPFLILLLTAMQFLTGSGTSIYLCIGMDGSWTIHSESAGCTSCESTGAAGHHSSPECSKEPVCSPCSGHAADHADEPSVAALTLTDSCDCTHVPVVVNIVQPSRAAPISIAVDCERLLQFSALPLFIGIGWQGVSRPQWDVCGHAAAANFSLTVVSTIVIRC